jgi:hypothetical protein
VFGLSETLDLARPVVGRAAGLHDHDGGRTIDEEHEKLLALQALPLRDLASLLRDPDLETAFARSTAISVSFCMRWAPFFAYTATTLALDAD